MKVIITLDESDLQPGVKTGGAKNFYFENFLEEVQAVLLANPDRSGEMFLGGVHVCTVFAPKKKRK